MANCISLVILMLAVAVDVAFRGADLESPNQQQALAETVISVPLSRGWQFLGQRIQARVPSSASDLYRHLPQLVIAVERVARRPILSALLLWRHEVAAGAYRNDNQQQGEHHQPGRAKVG